MADVPKDPRLQEVIDALITDLGPQYFVLNDRWDADLIAVGLSRPDDPHHLVYLTMESPDSGEQGLHFSCDRGQIDEPDFVYNHPQPGTYAQLREAVRTHLAPPAP